MVAAMKSANPLLARKKTSDLTRIKERIKSRKNPNKAVRNILLYSDIFVLLFVLLFVLKCFFVLRYIFFVLSLTLAI